MNLCQTSKKAPNKQRGIALLLLLSVVMATGVGLMLGAKNNSLTLAHTKQQVALQKTLTLAKEILLSRQMMNGDRPGALFCPDTNRDGIYELFSGSYCPEYTGYLPFKYKWSYDSSDSEYKATDIPNATDSEGKPALCYRLSRGLEDHPNSSPINSDVSDFIQANNKNQNEDYSDLLKEKRAFQIFTPIWNNSAQGFVCNIDTSEKTQQVISVSLAEHMATTEKMVARRCLACLREYAKTYNNTYPPPVPLSGGNNLTGFSTYKFGKLPLKQMNSGALETLNASIQEAAQQINQAAAILNTAAANSQSAIDAASAIAVAAGAMRESEYQVYSTLNTISTNSYNTSVALSTASAKATITKSDGTIKTTTISTTNAALNMIQALLDSMQAAGYDGFRFAISSETDVFLSNLDKYTSSKPACNATGATENSNQTTAIITALNNIDSWATRIQTANDQLNNLAKDLKYSKPFELPESLISTTKATFVETQIADVCSDTFIKKSYLNAQSAGNTFKSSLQDFWAASAGNNFTRLSLLNYQAQISAARDALQAASTKATRISTAATLKTVLDSTITLTSAINLHARTLKDYIYISGAQDTYAYGLATILYNKALAAADNPSTENLNILLSALKHDTDNETAVQEAANSVAASLSFPVPWGRKNCSFLSDTSSWFYKNKWNHLIFYQTGNLSIKEKAEAVPVVVLSAGRRLTGQNRPGSSVSDYFEGLNTSASSSNAKFENRPYSDSFNDQIFF